MLTPWLTAGQHTIRIFNANALTFRRVNLDEVQLLSAQGGDQYGGTRFSWIRAWLARYWGYNFNPGNGIPDWVDYFIAENNGITTSSAWSKVSPARIEGVAVHFDEMALSGGLEAKELANNAWVAEFPLEKNRYSYLQVDFENGAFSKTTPVYWEPTNLLQESAISLVEGDSLLLTAYNGWFPTGADRVSITIDGQTYECRGNSPLEWQFSMAGTYEVDVTHRRGFGRWSPVTQRQVTVEVLVPTNVSSPVVMPGHIREWTVPSLPEGAVLEFDEGIELRDEIPQADGSTLYLMTIDELETKYITVRSSEEGSVLQSIPVRGIKVRDGEDTSTMYVQDFSDGSYQVDMPSVVSSTYPDVIVQYNIFISGVTFEDGTISKDVLPEEYDAFGQAVVNFIKTGTSGSNCHRTSVFQDGVRIAFFF